MLDSVECQSFFVILVTDNYNELSYGNDYMSFHWPKHKNFDLYHYTTESVDFTMIVF